MLALNSLIPCLISFLFMECKPTRYHFELLLGKRARKKFSINRYCSLVLALVYMNMRFVVLSIILEQQIDDQKRLPFANIIDNHYIRKL